MADPRYSAHLAGAAFCPDPEPHTFFGDCPAEKVMDIQKIKSGVLRATLDSLTTSIFPRTVVKTSGVNISDVLNTENGAIIRADDINNVRTLDLPFVGDKSFPMLEYMDRVREERTGMTRAAQGLDAAALANVTATAAQAQFTHVRQYLARTPATHGKQFQKMASQICAKHGFDPLGF